LYRAAHLSFSTYASIDPAPATSGLLSGVPKPEDVTQDNIDQLKSQLLDKKRPLFERYRAMFALRNIGTPAAVDALAAGFSDDSALFKCVFRQIISGICLMKIARHEIAFVFGQLLHPHSVPCLLEVLQNSKESDMVRHEAAEALGGIATPEVFPHLSEWMKRDDAPVVVKESCQVALDMYEVCLPHLYRSLPSEQYSSTTQYENSGEFQYANGLEITTAPITVS
jgi:deoxyhypusine monooxygenase